MRATSALIILLALSCPNARAAPTPSFSQRLKGSTTSSQSQSAKSLKLSIRVRFDESPNASITGSARWGARAPFVYGWVGGVPAQSFAITLGGVNGDKCTLSGVAQLPTFASYGLEKAAGTYTCVDKTGHTTGTGEFTLKRQGRLGKLGLHGY